MGQEYSAEQRVQFQEFQKLIDAAIKDAPPYNNFRNSLAQVTAAVNSRHPFPNQNGLPLPRRLR